MSYIRNLKPQTRRHPTQHLTPEQIAAAGLQLGVIEPGELVGQREAVERINAHIASENERIARMVTEAKHIQSVAAEELDRAYGEIEALRAQVAELQAEVGQLEEENRRLRKRARKGKRERSEPDYNDLS